MKNLFTATMIAGLIFGLGAIIIPGVMLETYGISHNSAANGIFRNGGTALPGFVVLLWHARKSTSPEVHKAVLTTMFVYWLLSAITMTISQFSGLFGPMGWTAVVLHIGFLIAFAIFLPKQ